MLILLLAGGCEGRTAGKGEIVPAPSGRPAARGLPSAVAAVASALVVERPAEPEADPAPPPGDLRAEIEEFKDLRGCVQRHRLGDAAVADAVEALGYDRFISDVCRGIEALKARETKPCGEMLSSAMRRHCEEQVAMLTGRPELCPTASRVPGVPERAPRCLAAARRDVRPCAALVGMGRATCEGLVAHDPARCGTDGRCLRLVRRWMPVLPVAVGRPAHAGRVEVEVEHRGERTTLELEREAAQGAVVAVRGGKARLMIGDPRSFFVVDEERGGGLVLALPSWPPTEVALALPERDVQAVLRWRAVGALELPHGGKAAVRFERASAEVGGALVLEVTVTLGPTHAPRRTRWRIDTWLRDVVVEEDAAPSSLSPPGAAPSSSRPGVAPSSSR